MKNKIEPEMIAPCGMNCKICMGYFGYCVSGRKRLFACTGCRPRDKSCAFVKKGCENLTKKKIEFCYECNDFPCEKLEKLDKRYREKYDMSMIENLKYIEKNGIDNFIENEMNRWKCPKCGELICVHDKRCYYCEVK
jgi:hypothetical protein